MMNKIIIYFLILINISIANEVVIKKDTLKYKASGYLNYTIKPLKIIELYKNAQIDYKNMRLKAGYIKINVDSQTIFATYTINEQGDTIDYPVLKQENDTIYGDTILYNLKKEKGIIKYGRSKIENAFYSSETIKSFERKDIFLTSSRYTTCDLIPQKQHYYFYIKDLKVIPKDKAIARHIMMVINRVPVFYLPFNTGLPFQEKDKYFYIKKLPVFYFPAFVYPIRTDRHSGLLMPKIGKERLLGKDYYVIKETGFYWAINDYLDNLTKLSFYSTSNIALTNIFRYKLRYKLNGAIDAGYWYRKNSREWKLKIKHSQIIDQTSNLSINTNFISSDIYNQLLTDDLQSRLERVLQSNLLYNKRFSLGNFSLNLNRTENLDKKTITQKLPSLSFYLKRMNFKGFYFSYNFKSLYYMKSKDSTELDSTHYKEKRYGAINNFSITKSNKIKSYVNINQSINVSEVWFDKAAIIDTISHINYIPDYPLLIEQPDTTYSYDTSYVHNVIKHKFNYNLTLSNTLYGVFAPHLFGIKTLRHKLDPSVTFSYSPKDSDTRTFQNFQGISYYATKKDQMRINFSLNHFFQAKINHKDEEKKVDLFTINQNISYDKNSTNKKWSNFTTTFRANPIKGLNINTYITHDIYDKINQKPFKNLPQLQEFRFSTDYSLNLKFNTINIGGIFLPIPLFKFSEKTSQNTKNNQEEKNKEEEIEAKNNIFQSDWKGRYKPLFKVNMRTYFEYKKQLQSIYTKNLITSWANINFTWNISPRWSMAGNLRVDLNKFKIIDQEYKIYNDLHCWQFMVRIISSKYRRGYYLLLNIRDLQDIKIEQFRSF